MTAKSELPAPPLRTRVATSLADIDAGEDMGFGKASHHRRRTFPDVEVCVVNVDIPFRA